MDICYETVDGKYCGVHLAERAQEAVHSCKQVEWTEVEIEGCTPSGAHRSETKIAGYAQDPGGGDGGADSHFIPR